MRRHSMATLMGLTKKELVEYVRMAEHNQEVAEEALNQQAENVKDWIPVVRCRDCKYGKLDTAHRKKTIDGEYDEVGFYACCKGWLANDYNKGEHFCSYGERREGE